MRFVMAELTSSGVATIGMYIWVTNRVNPVWLRNACFWGQDTQRFIRSGEYEGQNTLAQHAARGQQNYLCIGHCNPSLWIFAEQFMDEVDRGRVHTRWVLHRSSLTREVRR